MSTVSFKDWKGLSGDMAGGGNGLWIFRVATAPCHGGGHLSRCLTLAEAMPPASEVLFHIDADGDGTADRIRQRGYTAVVDDGGPVPSASGTLLDGYTFGAETVRRYAGAGPMVHIHDFGEVPAGTALVVNSGFQMTGDTIGGIPALLGPRFALIGPEFKSSGRKRGSPAHVLVTMGRVDAANATVLALQALLDARKEGLKAAITVALGSECPHLDRVRAMLPRFGGDAALILDTAAMPALLEEADLVIGAGGVGLQERVAKGVPSVTVAVAANQERSTAAAVEKGLTAHGRPLAETSRASLCNAVLALAADGRARHRMAALGPITIDCEGPQRLAEALCDPKRLHHTPDIPPAPRN